MATQLFVITDAPRSGAFNMAADRYLLSRCGNGEVWLRFYGWQPPCVSLGYMQDPAATLDLEALRREHVDWVRRPTGGRAIMHWDDLTYSCVFSAANAALGRSIGESYAVIARCLIAGLDQMGICAEAATSRLDAHEARRRMKLPCFLAPNREEIMVNGRKLIGSAQKRTERSVLQHGSIPITAAFRRLPEFLAVDDQRRCAWRALLGEKAVCLEECGMRQTAGEIARILAQGFAEVLEARPRIYAWAGNDLQSIEALAQGEA